MFAASSKTSAMTLHWIMAKLVRNPRVMIKAHDEIRRVLAEKETFTEDSLSKLLLHPPPVLLLPHEC